MTHFNELEEPLTSESKKRKIGLDFKQVCFLCEKKRDSKGVWELLLVRSNDKQKEIHKKAKELHDNDVLLKIEGFGDTCIDMLAKDFRYHKSCMTKFQFRSYKPPEPCTSEQTMTADNIFEATFATLISEISDQLLKQKAIIPINYF